MNTLRGFGQLALGGGLRPFHVGTNQTAIFCDVRKMDLADYNDMFASLLPSLGEDGAVLPPKRRYLSPGENRDFLYSSLAAGAQNERLPVDFTAEQVGNWLDSDEESAEEVAKPLLMHLTLMQQRIDRQLARLGNAPAPAAGPAQKPKKNSPKPKAR